MPFMVRQAHHERNQGMALMRRKVAHADVGQAAVGRSRTGAHAMQFKVDNLSCQHCVRAVTAAIRARDANANVAVDLSLGRVAVDSVLPAEQVLDALAEEGYPARVLPGAD
jgi:copper chaperone